MKLELEPIIGLEIHIQLKTKSKMFCACDNRGENLPPNTAICPICLAHPGTLPAPNEQAVRFAARLGAALGCTVDPTLRFDRKHYFYPDLPKGYQISQFDHPTCANGSFTFDVPGAHVPRSSVTVRIERAHIEEDSAKSFHGTNNETLIDFNRGGTPLVETVTHPDFKTPLEARVFLQELRLLVRTLGVSDGDMEKGHLRCDANISLRPVGDEKLYPKTEIKNLNSFRSVERALEFEIARQSELWNAGTPVDGSTTRSWDDAHQKTVASRTKEGFADYRYFPEPDIPPCDISAIITEERRGLPELPHARRARFVAEYGFTPPDARQFIDNEDMAVYAEHVMSEFLDWIKSEAPETSDEELKPRAAKLVAGWLLSKYPGALAESGKLFSHELISPENFAEFLSLIYRAKINSTSAQTLLKKMIETGADPSHILEDQGLAGADSSAIAAWVAEVIAAFPAQVAEFKAGKHAVLQFLVGQVMKKSRGTADAEEVAEQIRDKC